MVAQANATLTRVTAAGEADDWDRNVGGSAGAVKWSGSVRAYYREKTDRRGDTGPGGVNVVEVRTLWVDTAEVPPELDTDDLITFTPDGGAEQSSPAVAIARSSLAGAEAVSTTRIDLEPA